MSPSHTRQGPGGDPLWGIRVSIRRRAGPAAYSRIMTPRVALSLVLAVTVAGALPGGGASAAPDQGEGIRDCGNVTSEPWVHYIRGVDDILEYKGNQWAVFGGKGLGPSCRFAKKWAKRGVHQASEPANRTYRKVWRRAPSGWRCITTNATAPVESSGGILQCLRYAGKGGGKRLIGSFSAGPDFNTQTGPF